MKKLFTLFAVASVATFAFTGCSAVTSVDTVHEPITIAEVEGSSGSLEGYVFGADGSFYKLPSTPDRTITIIEVEGSSGSLEGYKID